MKIIGLHVEQVKKVKVVTIHPNQAGVTKFSGDNGQGKTSMLDSIWYALGGIDTLPPNPVRQGEAMARIQLDLGDLLVEKVIYPNRHSELVVKDARTREELKRPQSVLNALLSKIAFDPLAFVRLKAKEQADELRGIVHMEVDPAELDQQSAEDYRLRTQKNSEVKRLSALIEGYRVPPQTTDEPIDMEDILRRYDAAHERNSKIEAAKLQKRMHQMRAAQHGEEHKDRLADIERLAKALEAARSAAEAALQDQETENRKALAIAVEEPIDVELLREERKNAEANNAAVGQKKERAKLEVDRDQLQVEANELTSNMAERERVKDRALREAKFPIEGLGLQGNTVMYNGLPLEQASGAEQLRIGLAVAMSGKPQLRFIRITDATMLGPKAMELVEQMAKEHDFQVFMEVVDPTGTDGFVMVDGELASTPETRAQGKPAKKATLK